MYGRIFLLLSQIQVWGYGHTAMASVAFYALIVGIEIMNLVFRQHGLLVILFINEMVTRHSPLNKGGITDKQKRKIENAIRVPSSITLKNRKTNFSYVKEGY